MFHTWGIHQIPSKGTQSALILIHLGMDFLPMDSLNTLLSFQAPDFVAGLPDWIYVDLGRRESPENVDSFPQTS